MYTYKLPEAQFEIKQVAAKLREIYPTLEVEFGYDEEVCRTVVFTVNKCIKYIYTHSHYRRQGYAFTHVSNLIKNKKVDSIIVSCSDTIGQILALKVGLVPVSFITPLIGIDEWSAEKSIRYELPKGKVRDDNPYLKTASDWVENSIVIEQFPTSFS